MIQFQLLGAKGITAPRDAGEGKLSMEVNIRVGVLGLPDEPKYYLPPAPIQTFTWDKEGLDSNQVEALLTAFATEFVKNNYPAI